MEGLKICLLTYAISAVVSFLVAFIIHMLCLLIKRFAPVAPAIPAAAANVSQQGGSVAVTKAEVEQEAEIAVALAAVKAYLAKK